MADLSPASGAFIPRQSGVTKARRDPQPSHRNRRSWAERPLSHGNGSRPRLLSLASSTGEEAAMIGKAKSETDEKRKHDEMDDELERELEDTFPASDPPSLTQPSESGAPDHKGEPAK
jgi:hypothetical protein